MKYNQPYGISDPNGPYINGNPSTGTMGSIPPAASIEYPQREIVNLITQAGLVSPDNADLNQLAKSVQSMWMNAQDDAGTANAYQVTMHPAPNAYYKYLMVIMKVANDNTGPSVLNVNALGPKPIVHVDGTALDAGNMRKNSIVCLMYDGASFQMVWSSGGVAGVPGMPVFLTAPKNLYVNGTTGNDTAYDGTAAAFSAGTIHGPFKTLQRAADEAVKYNLNGFNITIHVADGSYNKCISYMPTGAGYLVWIGNPSAPANVLVTGTGFTAFQLAGDGAAQIAGFKFTSTGSNPADPCAGIFTAYCRVYMSDCSFGNCSGYMIGISRTSSIQLTGTITIAGSSNGNPYSSGGFISVFFSATVETSPSIAPLYIVIPGPISLSSFVTSTQQATVALTWSSITGYGNVTGSKYLATLNGVINTGGGGVNYYPGTIAGTISAGGQYA